jgi:hypothetical protein
MKNLIRKVLYFFISPLLDIRHTIDHQVEENRILTAKGLINDFRLLKQYPSHLYEIEFKVFSQWGEDGIIQFILSKVPIKNEIFIEFGVEDYHESNTRFLLMNNNWSGLIIDANDKFMKQVRQRDIYWRHELTSLAAFVTRENINQLIEGSGIKGDIGLLSIDIDGMDYWVWESINNITPGIVICEYNSLFGCKESVSIPYSKQFNRSQAHHSNLYFGVSLKALCILAEKKGYVFVGSNKSGTNAFFVRKDISSGMIPITCEEGYVKSKVRESRDMRGNLTYISEDNRINLIGDKVVVDVVTNKEKLIRELSF